MSEGLALALFVGPIAAVCAGVVAREALESRRRARRRSVIEAPAASAGGAR